MFKKHNFLAFICQQGSLKRLFSGCGPVKDVFLMKQPGSLQNEKKSLVIGLDRVKVLVLHTISFAFLHDLILFGMRNCNVVICSLPSCTLGARMGSISAQLNTSLCMQVIVNRKRVPRTMQQLWDYALFLLFPGGETKDYIQSKVIEPHA